MILSKYQIIRKVSFTLVFAVVMILLLKFVSPGVQQTKYDHLLSKFANGNKSKFGLSLKDSLFIYSSSSKIGKYTGTSEYIAGYTSFQSISKKYFIVHFIDSLSFRVSKIEQVDKSNLFSHTNTIIWEE